MPAKKPKLPAAARDDVPRVSVTLTDETAWITRYDPRGKPAATYPAAVDDIANALRGAGGLTTGLIPEGMLFQTEAAGQVRVGLWISPAAHTLLVSSAQKARRLTAPLPGLVLVGQGRAWWVFAAKARPAQPGDRLYHAPLPNVHTDGGICQGDAKFPIAKAGTLLQAAAVFFESEFNNDLGDEKIAGHAGGTLAFLRGLRGEFPTDRLIDAGRTIGQVMAGNKQAEAAVEAADDDEAGYYDDDTTEPIGLAW